MFWRRAAPDPGVGPSIELRCGHSPCFVQVSGPTEILPRQRLPPKQAPPALLQIQPAGFGRDEDLLDPWMLCQPRLNGRALVAGEVVCDQIQVTCRIIQVDGLQELQVPSGIASGRAQGQGVPIAHAQCPVKPDLLRPSTVLQRRLDAVSIRGPARRRGMQPRRYRSEFIGADRRPRRVGVERDDGRSFGPKFRSVLLAQECVCRQGTPSASRMRRT